MCSRTILSSLRDTIVTILKYDILWRNFFVLQVDNYLDSNLIYRLSTFQGDKGDKGERGFTTTLKGDAFPTGIIEGPPGPPGPPGNDTDNKL